MTASVPEEPRRGTYFPAYVWVDQEGGGDLHANARECPTCNCLVSEAGYDAHAGRHEAEAGTEPK